MIMFKFFKEFLPAMSKLHTRQIKTKQFLTFSNHMNVTCFKQLHEESIDLLGKFLQYYPRDWQG